MTAPSPSPDQDSSKLMTDQRRSIFEHLGTGIREFFRWLILIGIFGLGLAEKQESETGEIDLKLVRAELEDSADMLIAQKAESAIRLWTIGVLIGLPIVVAIQTWGALALLKMK